MSTAFPPAAWFRGGVAANLLRTTIHNKKGPGMEGKTLPQIAYEAYAQHQDWKNYQGLPIPPWAEVRQDIQDAWGAATSAVCDAMILPDVDRKERVLDDIWANEAGVSIRFVREPGRHLRIEFTMGVGQPVTASATLTPWRAQRALKILREALADADDV